MKKTGSEVKPNGSPIRDRIKELRRVRAGDLVPNPQNWRVHPAGQQEALRGILEEVGYADALLARELPDGSLELVDGHLRRDLDPEQVVPVLVLDVDEAESRKILLTLDPLAAMATANTEARDALLRGVDTGSEALQAMLADLAKDAGVIPGEKGENDPNAEWQGMPEFEPEDPEVYKRLVVIFGTKADYEAFARLINQVLTDKTSSIWYTPVEAGCRSDEAMSDES